ncbi:flavin reductase family protein [Arthrobacter sp. NPDC056691]|uniref:flavin reductase family protein n=1 Tax=Arthrobacter sp. NPDC056691 TaxID=3345913 RepID=UPI00366EF017
MMSIVDSNTWKSDPALTEGFKGAMGLLAGAVTVITTGIGDTRRGLTATAVCSLSVEPPMILVCANRSGEAREMIWKSGFFCVNVLSGDDQDVANGFAGRSGLSGSEKFTVGNWGTIATGAPALKSALVSIDCELSEKLETHTHTVFLGQVAGLNFNASTEDGSPRVPLVYWDRMYRGITSQ